MDLPQVRRRRVFPLQVEMLNGFTFMGIAFDAEPRNQGNTGLRRL